MAAEAVEDQLLLALHNNSVVEDSEIWAKDSGLDHNVLVGRIKSLLANELITTQEKDNSEWMLTAEGEEYATKGSPEAQVFAAVPDGGLPVAELKRLLGPAADVGQKAALAAKWLAVAKDGAAPLLVRKVEGIQDTVQEALRRIREEPGAEVAAEEAGRLKKRKLVIQRTWKTYRIERGPKFALQRRQAATDLTTEMIRSGTWKDAEFKQYNFKALGTPLECGHLHPLLKVRAQVRQIFLELGFEEMPANNFVESSFWNFDALFVPQQHPARDSQDTFFLTAPATTSTLPEDYVARVKAFHERGGDGSLGYGNVWGRREAEKNVLRTHTTAVSARMLYKLAKEGFQPKKFFSVDRVFRNEAVDRTHLAEFHQVEGVICDRGMTLGDLIGTFSNFFGRLGMKSLRFKPTYNPYTEPSMEIYSYHDGLGKWVEIGNSGMFRPEMLLPMGLPPDVSVIAWGLSLERPTMILYGLNNIRDLFGHKVDLKLIRSNPLCTMGLQKG